MKSNRILLSHGEGGKRSQDLVRTLFLEHFGNRYLDRLEDGAVLPRRRGTAVHTTDSYVVKPITFPGGDIGMLSVHGTCNDLAVMGARPAYLSCGFILEEGLEFDTLEHIAASMADAAGGEGVLVVTGDTKVVARGEADGLFINTSGIGYRQKGVRLSPRLVRPGDSVIVSGCMGDHGIAVLSARTGLPLETSIESDAAPVWPLVEGVLPFGQSLKFMRDPTRGGLATVLCELTGEKRFGIELWEDRIPMKDEVRNVCDILGYDPLYVANEGKLVLIVSGKASERILALLKKHPAGRRASIIGRVTGDHRGTVVLRTESGGSRIVTMLSGDQLPRIC